MNENFTSDVGLQTLITNAELKKFQNSSENEENLYSFDLVDAINVMAYLIMSLGKTSKVIFMEDHIPERPIRSLST